MPHKSIFVGLFFFLFLENTHARTHESWLVCVLSLTWKSK